MGPNDFFRGLLEVVGPKGLATVVESALLGVLDQVTDRSVEGTVEVTGHVDASRRFRAALADDHVEGLLLPTGRLASGTRLARGLPCRLLLRFSLGHGVSCLFPASREQCRRSPASRER